MLLLLCAGDIESNPGPAVDPTQLFRFVNAAEILVGSSYYYTRVLLCWHSDWQFRSEVHLEYKFLNSSNPRLFMLEINYSDSERPTDVKARLCLFPASCREFGNCSMSSHNDWKLLFFQNTIFFRSLSETQVLYVFSILSPVPRSFCVNSQNYL